MRITVCCLINKIEIDDAQTCKTCKELVWKIPFFKDVYFSLISALTDLIVGALVMPLNIEYYYYNQHWVSSQLMCQIWLLTDVIVQTASTWSLVVIAIDRWMV